MNLTYIEPTSQADVVGNKREAGPNKRVENSPEKEYDLKKTKEKSKSQISSDGIEHSLLAKNEPLVDKRQRPGKDTEGSLVVTRKDLLSLDETTPNIFWDKSDSEFDTDTENDSLGVTDSRKKRTREFTRSTNSPQNSETETIRNDKDSDTNSFGAIKNPRGNNNQKNDAKESINKESKEKSRRRVIRKTTIRSEDNNNNDKQFDLVSIKYTTIFLRLFAPDSITTAEPKLGFVQQQLPGQSLETADVQLQESPLLDNPQTLDVKRKYDTTTPTSVTSPVSASSLSTRFTSTPIPPKPPITPSSIPTAPQHLPTNETIIVVKEDVLRVSSSGAAVKPPFSLDTEAPPATTAQSGLKAGTLLAAIIPVLVILLMILIAFVFVKRRKQFQKKRKRLRVDKEDVEEPIELNVKPEEPKNISSEQLYAKVDKSRKSRISTSEETTPLTTVIINGGPSVTPHNETFQNSFNATADDLDFVDNDLYERDSDVDKNSNLEPLTVTNYPEDDETYEIPENVVNKLEYDSNDQLAPPVPPTRTSSSPRNSAYFAATPPVPHRHSSLAVTSMTPPLPPRHSSLLSTPHRPQSKSFDMLDIDRDNTPKLPPRYSLRLPVKAKSASPENKRATFAGHLVPMPLSKSKPVVETSSESELDSSSESDFEELPPPREHAPPLPEGAEDITGGATYMVPDAAESEYLEPISLKANEPDDAGENHDYDPVYIPSNPGASHIAHLVDNTNYLKGARNRSPSKASINPYEEIQFGADVYADVDESTMTSPPVQTSTPAPPMLTPRTSRDLMTPPQLSPRSPNSTSGTPMTSRPTSDATPHLPSRSPLKTNKESIFNLANGSLNMPKEPRYSGLLLDSEDELDDHEYTPLDYEDHNVNNGTNENNVGIEEVTNNVTSNTKPKGISASNAVSTDSVDREGLLNETQLDYEDVPTENIQNPDEIYEPIEVADKDEIYEAIDFGDEA